MTTPKSAPEIAGSPRRGAAGLWTTPVRGRVALLALAWVLAYAAVVAVVIIGALLLARSLGAGRPPAAPLALAVLGGTAAAVLVAVRVHLLRRRGLRWADVGVRRPDRTPLHLVWQIPAVMGAAAVASMLVLIPLGHGGVAGGAIDDLTSGGPVLVVLGVLCVAVLVPIAEEIVFRGILLPALRARYRAVTGIVLAGAVFAAVHMLPPALPYLLVLGISLCAMAEWYRSIVPGIVLHGVNNALVTLAVLGAGGAG